MRQWHVWDEVPVAECIRAIGKRPLGGRWVDVNKGDSDQPDARCRYVAKEIAYAKSDDVSAGGPAH
eukprot:3443697-Lingulodinium_polyedra.AAC.1